MRLIHCCAAAGDSSYEAPESSSTGLTASKEQQTSPGSPAAPTGSAVETATARFALPTPTLAVRNLVGSSTYSMSHAPFEYVFTCCLVQNSSPSCLCVGMQGAVLVQATTSCSSTSLQHAFSRYHSLDFTVQSVPPCTNVQASMTSFTHCRLNTGMCSSVWH